jgi:hypothetical protein
LTKLQLCAIFSVVLILGRKEKKMIIVRPPKTQREVIEFYPEKPPMTSPDGAYVTESIQFRRLIELLKILQDVGLFAEGWKMETQERFIRLTGPIITIDEEKRMNL